MRFCRVALTGGSNLLATLTQCSWSASPRQNNIRCVKVRVSFAPTFSEPAAKQHGRNKFPGTDKRDLGQRAKFANANKSTNDPLISRTKLSNMKSTRARISRPHHPNCHTLAPARRLCEAR